MNMKRWVLAALAAFAVIFVLDMIVHMCLLKGLYDQTSALWRPPAEARQICWLMKVGTVLFAGLFAWIYAKGYEPGKPGLGQVLTSPSGTSCCLFRSGLRWDGWPPAWWTVWPPARWWV